MEDGENIEDLYDENKINDAEKIFYNEAAFREHEDIDFDAIDEKEDLDREVGDINYFFGDEEFIEEGDFDNFELNNNQIVQEKIKKLNIEIENSLIINENKENKIENNEIKIENNEIKIEELEDRIADTFDENYNVRHDATQILSGLYSSHREYFFIFNYSSTLTPMFLAVPATIFIALSTS